MKLLEGRLINVSNRLPVEVKFRAGRARLNPSAGGLASALDSIWRHHHGLWIGWAGAVDPETAASLLQKAARGRSYGFKAVPLSQHEVSKFYPVSPMKSFGRCSMTCRRVVTSIRN